MSDRKLAFILPPDIERLNYPPECPFKSHRACLTRNKLRSLGLIGWEGRAEVAPEVASLEQLGVFHSERYLRELLKASSGDLTIDGFHMGLGGPDTPVFHDAFSYGAWACGSALKAADMLLAKDVDIAFSLMGGFHHAMPERAAGFCYLNDVVLACARLAAAGKRVAYVDVDAHHGDGVQEAFYQRSDVLTISLHESGHTLFPWGGFETETGEDEGLGYNVNVPLPAGTYDAAFLEAFERVVMPVLGAYAPEAIVLELGMDILAGDPLTHLHMTNNVVVDVLKPLLGLNTPLLVAGGGGYHVENTVRGWALAWRTCSGDDDDDAYSLGLGGVMLGSSEWAGGLRDRDMPVTPQQHRAVDPELQATLQRVVNLVFPTYGLEARAMTTSGSVAGG